MKKIGLSLIIVSCLALTGCGRLTDGLHKDLGWVVENQPSMFPEGICDGGEEFFGNGKTEDSDDLFTVIESKIWGDSDE